MQKIIILALLCAVASCAAAKIGGTCDGTTAYINTMGVCQRCHFSCATCTGVLETECASCVAPFALASGKCECATSSDVFGSSAVAGTLACTTAGTATAVTTTPTTNTVCSAWAGFPKQFLTALTANEHKLCIACHSSCNTCAYNAVATDAAGLDTKCVDCWGTVAVGTGGDAGKCIYTTGATGGYVAGETTVVNETAGVEGYFWDSITTGFLLCPVGCLTCTTNADCSACAAGFQVNAGKTACECPAAGYFGDGATPTILCTACSANCKTCSAADVCTVCNDSTSSETYSLVSSACVASAVVSSSVEDAVETAASANDAANTKPPATCDATLIGCETCDATVKTKCTKCMAKYFQTLNSTTNSCECDAKHCRNATGGCGTAITTPCATGEACKVDSAAKQTCAASGSSSTTNGLLLTAASMIFAVILA